MSFLTNEQLIYMASLCFFSITWSTFWAVKGARGPCDQWPLAAWNNNFWMCVGGANENIFSPLKISLQSAVERHWDNANLSINENLWLAEGSPRPLCISRLPAVGHMWAAEGGLWGRSQMKEMKPFRSPRTSPSFPEAEAAILIILELA